MATGCEPSDQHVAASGRTGPVFEMMASAWRDPGFCVPNNDVYPHQWLWDSCFHALLWAEIEPRRAPVELWSAVAHQEASGFVPHMTYWSDSTAAAAFWGRSGTSSITQPPMYGHALAELLRRSVPLDVGGVDGVELVDRVVAGLRHLLVDRPRSAAGLVCVFHPWESGCDDSPRWPGAAMEAGRWTTGGVEQWRAHKGAMVTALVTEKATPVDSSAFVVGSVGFSALVAWNALEAARALSDLPDQPGTHGDSVATLIGEANALVEAIASRWSDEAGTWIDDPVHALGIDDDGLRVAARVRTSDALLALLVDPRSEALSQLHNGDAFGARFGPTGVHRGEAAFDPTTYWRGPAWPQMSYLLWTAAVRAGASDIAEELRLALAGGATASGLSEYWNPDSGAGLGAAPQTWAGLGHLASC